MVGVVFVELVWNYEFPLLCLSTRRQDNTFWNQLRRRKFFPGPSAGHLRGTLGGTAATTPTQRMCELWPVPWFKRRHPSNKRVQRASDGWMANGANESSTSGLQNIHQNVLKNVWKSCDSKSKWMKMNGHHIKKKHPKMNKLDISWEYLEDHPSSG